MGPTAVLATSVLRRRRRSVAVLAVLLGLTGAVALASIAGSLRGRDALDRFLEVNRPGSLEAFVDPALPPDEQQRLIEELVEAAGHPSFASGASVVVAVPGPDGPAGEGTDLLVSLAPFDDRYLRTVSRPIVVSGTLPLAPGEVAVNDKLARRRDVGPGDPIEVAVFEGRDLERVGNGDASDPKAIVPLRVGAVVRQPVDLARSPQAQPGTLFESDETTIVFHPGFWETHGPDLAFYGMGTVGHPPPDEVDRAAEAMREAGGERTLVSTEPPEDVTRLEPIRTAIDLEANALVVFAGLVAVLGLGLLGAAVGRVTGDDDADRDLLLAIGLTPGELAAVRLVRAGVVAVAACVVAVGVAIPLSALFPIGLAGDAEIDPGIRVDGVVLGVGALALAALVVGRALLAELAARSRKREAAPARPSRLGRAVSPAGPATTVGARMALDGLGPRGRAASRAAVATAVAGVVAVAGAATYAASLDRLADTPQLQGWTWDVTVGNFSQAESAAAAAEQLEANDDVEAFVGYDWSTLRVDGASVPIVHLTGEGIAPVILEGRAPADDDEVALGRGTLGQLGKEVGDTVEIQATGPAVTAEVVGAVVAPAVIAPPMDLDSGGVTTRDVVARVFADQPSSAGIVAFLVQLREDADRDTAVAGLREDFPGTVLGPMAPLDLSDLERVRTVPYLLAGMLGALTLGSVVLTLTTLARHRRRDVAVLRSLGFDRRQLHGLVAAQASTFTLVAIVVGIPLGLVAGRQAWRLAASGLGTEVGPVVPFLRVALAAGAVLLLVNLCAQVFATRIVRRSPGVDLRTE